MNSLSGNLDQGGLGTGKSASEQAAEVIRKGKIAALEKGQDALALPTASQAADKVLKGAAQKMGATHDPLAPVAQSAATKKDTPVAEAVREQLAAELGGHKEQDRIAARLVEAISARLERMPYEKVKEKYADPAKSSEEIALELLKEGEHAIVKEEMRGKTFEVGVAGSGVERGSDAALVQSAVDRARAGNITPAAAAAIGSLARQIEATRARARAEVAA